MSTLESPMPLPRARYAWSDLLRLLLLIGLATLLLPGLGIDGRTAAAQDRSVAYANFDVTLELREDGSFHVVERQEVSFTGGFFRTGFRNISLARTEGISNVTVSEVRDGATIPYQFESRGNYTEQPETFGAQVQSSQVEVKWAFPQTANDERTFLVEYDVVGALRVYDTNDPPYQQISWMAIGPELTEQVPVREASFTITLPEPVTVDDIEYSPADTPPTSSDDGRSWTWTASDLSGGESLDRALRFPPMAAAVAPAWQESSDIQEQRQLEADQNNAIVNAFALGAGLLALVVGGMGVFGMWYARGRDPHVGEVAEFLPQPPDDLPPGVAGTLIDEIASEPELVATMVDLARRGIMKINEQSSGGFLGIGSTRDFEVTLLDPELPRASFETDLLQAIFGSSLEKGNKTDLSSVKERIDTARPSIVNDLYAELVSRGYFPSSPDVTRNHWRTVGFVVFGAAIVAGFFLVGALDMPSMVWLPVVVVALLGLVIALLSGSFPRKTQAGAEAAARWRAFKRYLESIEQYEDLNEAKNIFERYLPYAIAFHIDRSWVQKFAAVQTPAPEWYDDGTTVFMPGTYGPSGSRQRRRGFGGNVVFLPGGGWGGGGQGEGGAAGGGGDGGDWNFPDLQGGSDSAGRSLQNASSGLFDLFNSAGSVFGGSSGGSSGGWGGGGGFSGGGGFGGGGGGGGGSSGGGGGGFN